MRLLYLLQKPDFSPSSQPGENNISLHQLAKVDALSDMIVLFPKASLQLSVTFVNDVPSEMGVLHAMPALHGVPNALPARQS